MSVKENGSDQSRHSEREFYYPEEEALNQMMPIPTSKKDIPPEKLLFTGLGRSVWEKSVPEVLSKARGRPSPVNSILYI